MQKKFDAVQFQRGVRAKLGDRYARDPAAFRRELKEKFGHRRKQRAGAP